MKPTQTTTQAVRAARAEASAWITQLHGPNRSPQMEEGLRRWLEERPENRREFEGLTEVWDLVAGGAPARGAPRLEQWEHSQEARELQALRRSAHPPRRSAYRLLARAAVIAGVSCAAAYAYFALRMPSYSTDVGEQRIVRLEDGTRVSLNSNTRLLIDYGPSRRRLRLEYGEALFEATADSRRPFIVTAGGHEMTALGTSFVVRHEAGRTSVTLVEGKVAVDSQKAAATLTAGQRLTLAEAAPPKLDLPRIEAVTAWRRGEVMLDDTPLADAVAEMNRYDRTAIVIDTPEISGLTVSGLYHTGDSEGFAHSVARMYRLEAIDRGGRIHLRK